MKNKYFTFLYVPKQDGGLKTVRLPKLLVFGLLAAVLTLVGSSSYVLVKYSANLASSHQIPAIERENTVLREQLDQYASQMQVLERQVRQNFDFQKKARLLANLDELTSDVTEVGVGGPEFGYVESLSLLDDDTRGKAILIKEDIEKLTRQARLQRQSYAEIISRLSDKQKLLGSTPSIRPVPSGFVSSRFGRRMDPFTGRSSTHYGVDYSARLGTPIFATADGVVTFAGKWYQFGWTVEISHGAGFVTRYAHASKLLVKKGQRVKRGDVIARVGSSGKSTATHLHYEVMKDGKKKNPLAYVLSRREVVD
ncbi:MAG: M23 family metallopeptidase [Candidatus Latescibacterota bacterium]|nr:MAG: M23 family metallopeptidase [Candidatus Latescibacterota bacterium]